MSELTLLVLRLGFLAVMWAFVFAIVYALRSDLFGSKTRRGPEQLVSPPVAPVRQPQVAPGFAPAQGSGVSAGAVPGPIGSGAAASPATPPGPPARRLVITEGPRAGLEVDLPADELTIGRSAACGLVIRDDYTSTNHARLVFRGTTWFIEDLGSTNGTTINGTPVTAARPLDTNTPVRIGTTTFELRR